ncbi:MAG TPA: stage III sporulation protein AA [Tissierellia bacterium]|jgi:stage III sporulation protein AA|nr:stage III sporulation protein AA [Tissierellia bacterium]
MINILNNLSKKIKNAISVKEQKEAVEIRLRVNSPLLLKTLKKDIFYNDILISKGDIDETIANFTKNSIHAFEKEINNGYITVEGGHRVGISGECIYEKNVLKGFKNITSLNIRIAREFHGCSAKYLKYLITSDKNIYNTLIIGPPLSGKTTFIRDITANLSDGFRNPYFDGCDITLIDERGELGAVYNGVPQLYVGRRTDVFSNCRKSDGFFMSIRAMSPKVIISDELGSVNDFEIIQYALKSGIKIITTAHGGSLDDVKKNIFLKNIIEKNFFDRALILNKEPLKIKEVFDFQRKRVVYSDLD